MLAPTVASHHLRQSECQLLLMPIRCQAEQVHEDSGTLHVLMVHLPACCATPHFRQFLLLHHKRRPATMELTDAPRRMCNFLSYATHAGVHERQMDGASAFTDAPASEPGCQACRSHMSDACAFVLIGRRCLLEAACHSNHTTCPSLRTELQQPPIRQCRCYEDTVRTKSYTGVFVVR